MIGIHIFFILLLMLALLIFVVGIINPKSFEREGKVSAKITKSPRLDNLIVFGIIVVILAGITNVTTPRKHTELIDSAKSVAATTLAAQDKKKADAEIAKLAADKKKCEAGIKVWWSDSIGCLSQEEAKTLQAKLDADAAARKTADDEAKQKVATDAAAAAAAKVKADEDIAAKAKAATASNVLFEAEITCQEYAESHFGVKNINVSYDQSSIKRQNADGTLLIKANIADSQGVFKPQKPLGIMECTTTSDGMRVTNFLAY